MSGCRSEITICGNYIFPTFLGFLEFWLFHHEIKTQIKGFPSEHVSLLNIHICCLHCLYNNISIFLSCISN